MTTLLMPIEEPQSPRPANGLALWELGFRPFYLLASGFACLSVLLWALQFTGWWPWVAFKSPLWHAHEMLFGYGLAVMVGFLFTAGRNWTGYPTPSGLPLALLALLWVAGRVLVLTPWGWTSAIVNAAFPLAAAVGLAIPLIKARNTRNFFFVGVLLCFAAAQLFLHLAQLGVLSLPGWVGLQIAMDLMMFVMVVMGGRVIPMFTNNGVPGAQARRHDTLERLALAAVLLVLAADLSGLQGPGKLMLLALTVGLHAARLYLWQPWTTLRTPLVWVLHAGYAFIVLHLALRAFAEAGLCQTSLATHALTAGAIGTLTIGMMTRTARGHTARPLRADAFDQAAYLCVIAAALLRVGAPLMAPALMMELTLLAAALWACGFGIYAVRYAPLLLRPRMDGKPG